MGEDEALKGQLKKEEEKNAELQKGVSGLEEMKSKVESSESESVRLNRQLKELQSQLDTQRAETRKQREEAAQERKKKEQAEGELKRLQSAVSDSSKAASALTTAKDAAERDRDREHQRAERLAAKLKQLRDE